MNLKNKIRELNICSQKRRSFMGMVPRSYNPQVYDAIRLGIIRCAGIDIAKKTELSW